MTASAQAPPLAAAAPHQAAALPQQPPLPCSVSRKGRLLDFGEDPLKETACAAVQTAPRPQCLTDASVFEGPGVDDRPPPAWQVLRIADAFLGMEMHERTKPWAEGWLMFKDRTNASLGLSASEQDVDPGHIAGDLYKQEQQGWQARVLGKLQEVARVEAPEDRDFQEQLEVAKYALGRVAHAVSVLQDPEQEDRPLVLRQYTEAMVREVCGDLRQWLEQLGSVVSVYHVHLLDLLRDRRRLQADQVKLRESEAARKAADQRLDTFKQLWEEEKMRRGAARILGQDKGDDYLIYSQKDFNEMQTDWQRRVVQPLQNQVMDMRNKAAAAEQARRDLARELEAATAAAAARPPPVEVPPEPPGLSAAALPVVAAALGAVAERVVEETMSQAVLALSAAVAAAGAGLDEALQSILELPYPIDQEPVEVVKEVPVVVKVIDEDHPAMHCLSLVGQGISDLELKLKASPSDSGFSKLLPSLAWYRSMVAFAASSILAAFEEEDASSGPPQPPDDAPEFEPPLVVEKPPTRAVGVNTELTGKALDGPTPEDTAKVRAEVEAEWQAKLDRLTAEMEARLRKEREAFEAEKLAFEDAIKDLEASLHAAEQKARELRKRLLDFEKAMRAKGQAHIVEEALVASGLGAFFHIPRVFERLYEDAVHRMHRLAEAQRKRHEETSAAHTAIAQALYGFIREPPRLLVGSRHQRAAASPPRIVAPPAAPPPAAPAPCAAVAAVREQPPALPAAILLPQLAPPQDAPGGFLVKSFLVNSNGFGKVAAPSPPKRPAAKEAPLYNCDNKLCVYGQAEPHPEPWPEVVTGVEKLGGAAVGTRSACVLPRLDRHGTSASAPLFPKQQSLPRLCAQGAGLALH